MAANLSSSHKHPKTRPDTQSFFIYMALNRVSGKIFLNVVIFSFFISRIRFKKNIIFSFIFIKSIKKIMYNSVYIYKHHQRDERKKNEKRHNINRIDRQLIHQIDVKS
jgi:hypothetical protein